MNNPNDLISREAFRSSIQTVLNDTTCPIHIAAEIEEYLELEPAVDAIPMDWMESQYYKHMEIKDKYMSAYAIVLAEWNEWKREQEAR